MEISNIIKVLKNAQQTRADSMSLATPGIIPDESRQFALFNLLENATKIVDSRRAQRTITDWPFENFWDNPNEPRHSKLIEYFISPLQDHGCGKLLLQKLFKALCLELPVDCYTHVCREFRTDSSEEGGGRIDILVTRDHDNRKYAVIIENKVNGASDTSRQLYKYVDQMKQNGFAENQIHVRYLSLSGAEPGADSREGIGKDVDLAVATFQKNIVEWLEDALQIVEHEAMHDNLKHYLNLVKYLLNRQKEQIVRRQKILEQLDNEKSLPTLADLNQLVDSAILLKDCWRMLVRRKLLEEVEKLLTKKHAGKLIRRAGWADGKVTDYNSLGEANWQDWLSVGIEVNSTVVLAIWLHWNGLFEITYDRIGAQKDTKFREYLREHKELSENEHSNPLRYRYIRQDNLKILLNENTYQDEARELVDKIESQHEVIVKIVHDYLQEKH